MPSKTLTHRPAGPTSTYQRVLFLPELLSIIFGQLPGYECRKLARTCRGFIECALDEGWRLVRDMSHVLNIWVASGVLRRAGDGGAPFEYGFSRQPRPEDVARLFYYTSRIRQMRVHGAADSHCVTPVIPIFAPNFFHAFDTYLHKFRWKHSPSNHLAFLFPRLKNLRCVPFTNFDWKGCEFFLRESPQLFRVDISSIEGRFIFEWCPLVRALLEYAPDLRDLALVAELAPQTVPPKDLAELAYLIEQRGVEELILHDAAIASPQVLTAMANNPNLQRLIFLSLDDVLHPICNNVVVGRGFSALTSISGQFMTVLSMLHAAPFSGLQEINVKYPITWTASPRPRLSWNWDSIRVFLEVVADQAPNLQSLHFNLAANDIEPSTQDDGPCAFLPLARCRHLRLLDIDLQDAGLDSPGSPYIFNPTDDDWLILCKAWPQLTGLWYVCGPNQSCRSHTPPFNPTPKATPKTILQLLQHCKSLQTINIPIRATKSGVKACLADARSVRHFSLIEIEAWGSHIEPDCVEDLANLLSTVAQSPHFGLYAPVCSQLAIGPAQPPHHYDEVPRLLDDVELGRCRTWRRVVTLIQRSRTKAVQKKLS
ncbi:hypothetical protein M407DRAFT_30681 [Tulasnella calospora MUT 4182]|uniref:F-box domain-containing protein n=1 Tax=Tulasnella calospora MUT 4182 TaxID=1051891 RepID=A0A0C3PX83_9AGAM|nr:hypothetical protein M407DRAFT_30681 [Tulasnella calospora MUT 4182]